MLAYTFVSISYKHPHSLPSAATILQSDNPSAPVCPFPYFVFLAASCLVYSCFQLQYSYHTSRGEHCKMDKESRVYTCRAEVCKYATRQTGNLQQKQKQILHSSSYGTVEPILLPRGIRGGVGVIQAVQPSKHHIDTDSMKVTSIAAAEYWFERGWTRSSMR